MGSRIRCVRLAVLFIVWAGVMGATPMAVPSQTGSAGRMTMPDTAAIAGQVLSEEPAPRPIRRAIATLRSSAGDDSQSAITDDDGRFEFTGLASGRYTVTAAKPAWLETAYGATQPGGPGTAIVVGAAERIDISLRLAYGAILEGRIISLSGEPMPGMHLSALRLRAGGEPKHAGRVEADDRGIYRIFGLPGGEYLLRATLPPLLSVGGGLEQAAASSPDSPSKTVVFAPVYFPGAESVDRATVVTVRAGEERGGLDVMFAPVRTGRVQGIISGPVRDITAAQLRLEAVGTASLWTATKRPAADGTFTFERVPPGRYTLTARANPGELTEAAEAANRTTIMTLAAAAAANTVDAEYLWAETDMSLRSDDERSVALALEPGGSISGRVAFISQGQASAGDPAGIRISLSPTSRANAPVVSSGSFLMRRDVAVRADGTFSIRGLGPGAYGLRVELPADLEARGWWPRSAIVDGRDLLDLDPELTTSRDLDDVIVTIADSHTELSGVLHTAAGGTASDYFMVVFSADPRNWRALSRRTQVARPATDGRFEIHDLPAGEYFLGAVTTIDADELLTPAFFEQLVAVSTRVTLGENERRRQDVRLAR